MPWTSMDILVYCCGVVRMEMNKLELLDRFEADSDWLRSNKDKLRNEYANKFVAVLDGEVVDSNVDLEILIKDLKKKDVDPGLSVIEFISKERYVIIY